MVAEKLIVKKIRGDGLSLKLRSNKQILEITGDGCTISMNKNVGCVRIVGDGCRLRIDRNLGNVEYTGDGGRVLLGAESSRDKVRYTGDGGEIIVDGDDEGSLKQEVGRDLERETEKVSRLKKKARRSCTERKVVKIVTTFQFDERIMNEWFVNPEEMVRSFDGASFVKIVPKQRETTVEVE